MSQEFIYQLINHENGNRSRPFTGNWDTIAKAFDDNKENIDMKNYLLLVATIGNGGEQQTEIPQSPLITVQTFMDMYAQKPQENG